LSTNLSQLTCIIPTRDRPGFLRRLLLFLSTMEFPWPIQVYDSSNEQNRRQNEITCQQFAANLSVNYRHADGSLPEKLLLALKNTTTPYTVLCADDDFLAPAVVSLAADFLESHADHSRAGGLLGIVTSNDGCSDNKLDLSLSYNLSHESPLARIGLYARHWFSTFYYVHRTEQMRENFRFVAGRMDFRKAFVFPEWTLSYLGVLQGKVKVFTHLGSVIQVHRLNDSHGPLISDAKNKWKLYANFRSALAEQIVKYCGIETDRATTLVDRWYRHRFHGKGKLPPVRRLHREIVRTVRKLIDRVRRRSYLQGRPLGADEPLRDDLAWKLACRLIRDYPDGMTEEELHIEQQIANQHKIRAA